MNRRQFLQNALKAAAVVPVAGVAKLVGEQPATEVGVNLLPDMEAEFDLGWSMADYPPDYGPNLDISGDIIEVDTVGIISGEEIMTQEWTL
jgi:hypothetical protein